MIRLTATGLGGMGGAQPRAATMAGASMLAIECRDNRVSLASSRAARVEFLADGKTRSLQTSGGGAVKVVAKCDGTLASIKIDPQALNPSDAQLLEDMIMSAANNALSQAKEISTAEMGKVTQGFSIPGLV